VAEKRELYLDRRSVENRRTVYDIDYFLNGGVERRTWKERRSPLERRSAWFRVSEWVSVSGKGLGIDKALS